MKLFHGTTSRHLPSILADGLTPRNQNEMSNWDHSIPSNAQTVYLTDAYALYFAAQASKVDEQLVVLEIDTSKMNQYKFVADEDAIEQATRGQDKLPKAWDMHKRTMFYRERADQYSWEGSLKVLGTCGYRGVISPQAFTRVALVEPKQFARMVWSGYDPSITVMNYRIVGHNYRFAMRWLFDENAEQEVDNTNPFSAIGIFNIPKTREGIEVLGINEAKMRFIVE
jgi:hypothetical protein